MKRGTQLTRREALKRSTLGLVSLGLARVAPARCLLNAADNDPLRVGISPIFPPMAFLRGKVLTGVEVDLARGLGQHLGRPVVFVQLPWDQQIASLNAGKTDIIMSSMSITPARGHVVAFTRPYFVLGQMALIRREDRGRYVLGFPQPLPGQVGVLKATTGEFLVQREFPTAKRKSYSDPEAAVAALKKKKIDLFISDSTLVWYLAGNHSGEGVSNVPMLLTEEPLGWAVRRDDERLLKAANEFIERSLKDESLVQTFRRWGATGG
jgi:polar amino acid transport system substrate-binding protein